MKKCISCQQEIDDGAVFCPLCGTKQDAEAAKQTFPITERSFCRIFRPSFFGGLQINRDTMYKFMTGFLSLTRAMTDDEVTAVNHAFDTLLNNASKEYNLGEKKPQYALDGEKRSQVESEKFRYNFVSDSIFHTMEQYYKSSGSIGVKHYGNVWLFSMLSALDGNYSDEKLMLFRRIKNLFPVTREQFLESIVPSNTRYNDEHSFLELFKLIPGMEKVKPETIHFKDYYGNITFKYDNGEETSTSIDKLKEQIVSDDFDFYELVEKKTKALCELEYEILQLESSEGKYADIADKIAELARKERELTNSLPGFVYQKF